MKQQLMLVAMLSVGTALTTMGRLKPVAASLTPPTNYDYSYTWNATDSEQYLNVNGVDSIPLYTRTVNGIYFDYNSSFNVMDGFLITQIFNRSNTTWQSSGTFYKPDENKIGSNHDIVGVKKMNFIFDNQTNKNYTLYLDISSVGTRDQYYEIAYNNVYQSFGFSATLNVYNHSTSILKPFFLPSYTIFSFNSSTLISGQHTYFDAWYLQDLGISDSYQAGLDAETQGILTDYLGTDAQQIGWVLIGIAAILFAFKGGK